MRLSIQRQCDGPDPKSPRLTCEERLEITTSVPDPVNRETSKQWTDTWEQLATNIGWRRTGGPGQTYAGGLIVGDTQYAIPSTRCWVVCPRCAKLMGLTGTGFDAFPPEGPT